jgi:hypothetical protein
MALPKSLKDLGIGRAIQTFTNAFNKAGELALQWKSLSRINTALDKQIVPPQYVSSVEDSRNRFNNAMHALHTHELMLPDTEMLVKKGERIFTPKYLGSLGVTTAEIANLQQTRERHATAVAKAMQEDIGLSNGLAKQLQRNLRTFKGDAEDYKTLLETYANTSEALVVQTGARSLIHNIGTWFQETSNWVQTKYLHYATTHLTPPPPILPDTLPPPLVSQPSVNHGTPMTAPPPPPPPPPLIKDPAPTLTPPSPAKKKPDVVTQNGAQDGHSELMAAIQKRRPVEEAAPAQTPSVVKAAEPQLTSPVTVPLPQNNGMSPPPPPPPPPPYSGPPSSRMSAPTKPPLPKTHVASLPRGEDHLDAIRARADQMAATRVVSDKEEKKTSPPSTDNYPLYSAFKKILTKPTKAAPAIIPTDDVVRDDEWDTPPPPTYRSAPPSPPSYSPPRTPESEPIVEKRLKTTPLSPPSQKQLAAAPIDIKRQLEQRRQQLHEDDDDVPDKDDDWDAPPTAPAEKWSATTSEKANAGVAPFPAEGGSVKPLASPGRTNKT